MQAKHHQERVTPFDWQRSSQQPQGPCAGSERRAGGKKTARQESTLSATERAQRILATRWASPYSRAGAPSSKPSF